MVLTLCLALAGCGDDDDDGGDSGPDVATATQTTTTPPRTTPPATSTTPPSTPTTPSDDDAAEDDGDDAFDSELGRQVRRNFMTSCERSSGGQEDYCECVFDGLRAKEQFRRPEDFAKLDRLAADAQDGEVPQVLQGVVTSCRGELN